MDRSPLVPTPEVNTTSSSFVPPNLTELTAPIGEEDPKEEKFEEPASESEPSDSKNESVDDLTNLQSAPRTDKVTKLRGSELFKMQAHASLSQHKLAAIHLAAWQYWVFTIPMAVIAMVTGILAFVATTELFSEHTNSILNCIVGSLSFLTVFMQTLSSQCTYDVRASMHENTAVDLRDLREDLDSTSRKESVLIGHGGDDNSKKPGKTLEEEFDTIVKRYNQCLKGCKSTVPIQITDAFKKFESKLDTTMSLVGTAKLREIYGEAYYFKVVVQGYDSLAAAYSCYWMWPFILRNPIKVVDETMKELKESIWGSKDYWDFEKTPLLSRNKLVGQQHSSDTVEERADAYV